MTLRRPTRGLRATTTIVALFVMGFSLLSGVGKADTASDLKAAEAKLNRLIDDISAATRQANTLQSQLNEIAHQIDLNQGAIEKAEAEIVQTQQSIAKLAREIAGRQKILDQRAVAAYETGPASSLEFFLGSTSVSDLQDRIEIVNAAAQSDQDLITQMQERKSQLHVQQVNLQFQQDQLQLKRKELEGQQRSLDDKFAQQKAVLSQLAKDKSDAETLVQQLRAKRQREIEAARIAAAAAARLAAAQTVAAAPSGGGGGSPSGGGSIGGVFGACPVQGSHAYSDSFGAPRYGGGYHPHAGTDIMAPLGTPIVAPFSGNAVANPNGLGGLAVTVYGAQGSVYNAHLSGYGNLGSVSTGTVIGYVGNSGDAVGGPTHDHFEWHPNVIPANPYVSVYGYSVIGDAIDPYPYLNAVC